MYRQHRSLHAKPQAAEAATMKDRLRALRQVLVGKTFAPFWLCFALILGLLPVIRYVSPVARIADIDLSRSGFPHSYVMTSKTEPNRGYLVDRRDSTVRRSRKNLPGKMWDVDRFGEDTAAGIPEHFLLRSKRYGTVFFIPVEAVKDFSYPFIYGFVRREYPELELPEATWTQLFLNRVYHGLYLEMRLPFDPRKKDGGSGTLRELLMVHDNEMTLVDTRLNPDARFYEAGTALGLFPGLKQPQAVLSWLAARCPNEHATLLLSNVEPYEVSLLPLPYSVERLYQRLQGTALQATLDDRFRLWTAPLREQDGSQRPPFDEARQQKFDQEFRDYSLRIRVALDADRVLHPEAVYHARLPLENPDGPPALEPQGTRR
jgi:hypothetical protein